MNNLKTRLEYFLHTCKYVRYCRPDLEGIDDFLYNELEDYYTNTYKCYVPVGYPLNNSFSELVKAEVEKNGGISKEECEYLISIVRCKNV